MSGAETGSGPDPARTHAHDPAPVVHHHRDTDDDLAGEEGSATLRPARRALGRAWRRLRSYAAGVRDDGLPTWGSMLWLPLVGLVVVGALTAAGISGTSTGMLLRWLHGGSGQVDDPALLLFHPRQVRSDEWFVQMEWVLSQYRQGFPAVNQTFPGGWDATVLFDVPARHWTMAFRPHLLPLLVLPVDQGVAWRWWLPGLLAAAGVFWFVRTLLPRSPWPAPLLAAATLYQPYVQWWYQPITVLPVAAGFVALTAGWWCLRTSRAWERWVWAAAASYVAAAAVLSLYPPFLVATAWLVAAVTAGMVWGAVRADGWGRTLRALVPLLLGGVAALTVLGLWVWQHRQTFVGMLGTAYPGRRVVATGSGADPASLASLAGAPWNVALLTGGPYLPGDLNQSEASTAYLVGAWLLVPLAGLLVADRRAGRRVDPLAAATVAVAAVVALLTLVPGLDLLGRLIGFGTVPVTRQRMFWLALAPVAVVLLARRTAAVPRGWGPAGAALGTAATLAAGAYVAGWQTRPVAAWPLALAALAGYLAALWLLGTRRLVAGCLAFALVSGMSTVAVHPVYRGVLDLRTRSELGRTVAAVDAARPGTWVALGTYVEPAALLHNGVRAYNGMQTHPSAEMWRRIDPEGRYAEQANRLGMVRWVAAPGEPVVSNPYPDQVQVTFDPCSRFAAAWVDYVVAPDPVPGPCVRELAQVGGGWVYEVVAQ